MLGRALDALCKSGDSGVMRQLPPARFFADDLRQSFNLATAPRRMPVKRKLFIAAAFAIAAVLLGIFLFTQTGCKSVSPFSFLHSSHTKTPPGPGSGGAGGGDGFKGIELWLGVFVVASIITLGVAAFCWNFAPMHWLSLPLAGGAGTVLGASLFLKVTLWLVPWIAGVLLLGGVILYAHELYRKFKPAATKRVAA